jgi:hypothetical protein
MTAREYYKKLRGVDLNYLKEEAVLQSKEEILAANREQLREGRSATGQLICPSYSPQYLRRKRRMSSYRAPGGTPDLFLRGDFQGEMDVIVESGGFDIVSWNEKNAFLQTMYDDLFGLTAESIEKVMRVVTKRFSGLLKDKLN